MKKPITSNKLGSSVHSVLDPYLCVLLNKINSEVIIIDGRFEISLSFIQAQHLSRVFHISFHFGCTEQSETTVNSIVVSKLKLKSESIS